MANNIVFERIKQDVTSNPVVLYMKGTPVFPQCGFSAAVVQILSELGVKFKGIDVLTDPEIRQGIKEFSSWPTIPQLYVKGEFVGGCDIIREMAETGELKQLLETNGVVTRAGDERRLACRPPFRRRRHDKDAVDATAIHVDDFETVAIDDEMIGDPRHPVDLRHHEAAERLEVAALLARQQLEADHVLHLVDRHQTVDQP